MPATAKQVQEALVGLTPEEQDQFLSALEKARTSEGLPAAPPQTQAAADAEKKKVGYTFSTSPNATDFPIEQRRAAVADFMPILGGTVGGLSGGIQGGMLGGAAGESARQLLRRLAGLPAAPGMIQERLGVDPNSPEAALAGLGGETLSNLAAGGAAKGIAALAKFLPAQALRSATKALGFTKAGPSAEAAVEHTPFLLGREGPVLDAAGKPQSPNVFVPGKSNAPAALLERLQKLVDNATAMKNNLLAGELGDAPLNPDEVRRAVGGKIGKLEVPIEGGGKETFASANSPIAAKSQALEDFNRMQEAGATAAGKGTTTVEKVGEKVSPIVGADGERMIEDILAEKFHPDTGYLTARQGENIRRGAQQSYRAALDQAQLGGGGTAGAGEKEVMHALKDQLNQLSPQLRTANETIHHALGAQPFTQAAENASKVGGSNSTAARAGAAAISGSPLYGATLGAGSSALRSAGISGQTAAILEALSKPTAGLRSAAANYPALQAILKLITGGEEPQQ